MATRPAPTPTLALDLSPEAHRALGHRAVDLAVEHATQLRERARPAWRAVPDEVRRALLEAPVPLEPTDLDALLDEVRERVLAYPMGNGHPGFFGWVNSGPATVGTVAELLAASMDPSVAGGDHAAHYVERAVVRWIATLLGMPESSGGLMVSGASMAAIVCLAAARQKCAGWDVRREGLAAGPPLAVYASAEAHSCVLRAVEVLGLGARSLRVIPVDEHRAMRLDVLAEAIERDVAAGERPVCVVASAGTVNTGAIDPLAALRDVCDRHAIWLHVDGAYGAPAVLVPELSARFEGLGLADSVGVDGHKWLFAPIACGVAVVREPERLRDALSVLPPYLSGAADGPQGALPWLSEHGVEQTRAFRAFKLWMILRAHGVRGIAAAIEDNVRLARTLATQLRAAGVEVITDGPLSIVCFRYVPRGPCDGARLDAINRALLIALQHDGRCFLTSTVLDGRFVLRACVVNPRSTDDDIEALVRAVTELGPAAEVTSRT